MQHGEVDVKPPPTTTMRMMNLAVFKELTQLAMNTSVAPTAIERRRTQAS